MSEERLSIIIEEKLDLIITLLKSINQKLGNQEPQKPSINEESIEESIEQDLTKVTITFQTDKAVLAVKNGYQAWVIKKAINNEEIPMGVVFDLDVQDWHPKLEWEPFKVRKK